MIVTLTLLRIRLLHYSLTLATEASKRNKPCDSVTGASSALSLYVYTEEVVIWGRLVFRYLQVMLNIYLKSLIKSVTEKNFFHWLICQAAPISLIVRSSRWGSKIKTEGFIQVTFTQSFLEHISWKLFTIFLYKTSTNSAWLHPWSALHRRRLSSLIFCSFFRLSKMFCANLISMHFEFHWWLHCAPASLRRTLRHLQPPHPTTPSLRHYLGV